MPQSEAPLSAAAPAFGSGVDTLGGFTPAPALPLVSLWTTSILFCLAHLLILEVHLKPLSNHQPLLRRKLATKREDTSVKLHQRQVPAAWNGPDLPFPNLAVIKAPPWNWFLGSHCLSWQKMNRRETFITNKVVMSHKNIFIVSMNLMSPCNV